MSIKRKTPKTSDKASANPRPGRKPGVSEDPPMGTPTLDPAIIVEHPASFPDGSPPYNLIRSDTHANPLVARGPLDTHTIFPGWKYRVYLDGDLDPTEHEVTAQHITDGFIPLTLQPTEYLLEDTHSIQWDAMSSGEFVWNPISEPVMFTIDTEPPGAPIPGELEFPDDVHQDGLSDERLTELGNVLVGVVPSYMDRLPGDTIVGYVRNDAGEEEETDPFQIEWDKSTEPIELEFTRAMLANLGDGILNFTYIVTDLAGNPSVRSEDVEFDVFLQPGIADLEPPLVPLYDDDPDGEEIIDEADARTPVQVHIPGHADIETGDTVVVSWGSRQQPAKLFNGPDSELPVILEIDIPYGDVLAEWADADQDAEGFASIDVNYTVFRANRPVGSPPTPHTVVVNLSTPGGVDPDPETPEHEALGAPYVHHEGWQATDPINVIPDSNVEENHHYYIPWFTRDDLGNPTTVPAFNNGDRIVFQYDGTALPPEGVTGQDVIDAVDLEYVLPWTLVKEKGSGTKPIQYTAIRYYGVPPDLSENPVISPPSSVEVEDSLDVPGGPNGLLPARFDAETIAWSQVGGPDGLGHAPLTVKAYEGMRIGDIVRVHVTADERDPNDGSMGDPYLRAEWGGDEDRNPHPVYPHVIGVTAANIDTDLKFGWPAERVHWTYAYGWTRVTYSVTRMNDGPRAVADADDDQRTDVSRAGPPEEPDEPFSTNANRRMTLAEATKAGPSGSPERQAALNEFVRQWATNPQRLRNLRERRKNALKALANPVAPPKQKLTTRQATLLRIAQRPIPKK